MSEVNLEGGEERRTRQKSVRPNLEQTAMSARSPRRMVGCQKQISHRVEVAQGPFEGDGVASPSDRARMCLKGRGTFVLTARVDSDNFYALKARGPGLTSGKGSYCAKLRRCSGPERPLGNEGHLSVSERGVLP